MHAPFLHLRGRSRTPDAAASSLGVLDDVDEFLEQGSDRGAQAVCVRRGRLLLTRVLRARLVACRNPDPSEDRRLAVAAAALQQALEQRHARRSHALEWAILVLIAVDIAIQWL